jgi:ABC-2 type transport system permease protein
MKILDIALKDMLRNFRSVYAIGMMFIVPLLITGLIYSAFGGGSSGGGGQVAPPATQVVVVNLDTPPANSPDLGQMLVRMLGDPSVSQWLSTTSAASPDEAVAMVNRQAAGVAVIVPPGFTQAILSGAGKPVVRIVQDPTLTIGPMVVQNMIGSLIDGSAGARIAIQADLERRTALNLAPNAAGQAYIQAYQDWFTTFQHDLYHTAQAALLSQPPSLNQGNAPANQANDMQRIIGLVLSGMAIFFGFETGAFTMQSILKEDEEGTLARIFTTPTSRTAILTGKFLAVVLMVLVQGLAMLAAGALIFKVNWGNPLNVALALLGQVLAATSLGVFLISLIKTTRQAGPVLGGALTVLGMLGGLFSVAVSLPESFNTLSLFTPQGWVLRAWTLTLNGAAPTDLILPVAVLATISLVLFAAGAFRFQRRYA